MGVGSIVRLTCRANAEHSVRRIAGGNWGNAKDRHHLVGRGQPGDIARALVNFAQPDWPASGTIVRATLSGWTSEVANHANFHGNSPRVQAFRNDGAFTEQSGGASAENIWTQSAPDVWPGPDIINDPVQFQPSSASNKAWSVDLTRFAEAWAPARIKRRNGSPGGARRFRGITLRSANEDEPERSALFWTRRGNADRRMVLTIEIDTAATPNPPVVTEVQGAVAGTSDPTVVGTDSGRELTVSFGFSSPTAGDRCAKAELALYEPTADDDAAGPAIATTGWVTPVDLPSGANQHRLSLTGLPRRREGRFRIRTQSQHGKVGGWSSLEDAVAHVQLATIGGVPIDPRMQGVTDDPSIFATINSADPDDYATGIRVEAYRRVDGERTQAAFGEVDIGGTSTRRAEARWSQVSGVSLRHDESIEWRVWIRNRDLVWGRPTAWLTQVVRDRVGPTLTPDQGRFTTRTPQFTITDASFDGWRLRLLSEDGNTVLYDSGVQAIGATTSHGPTVPAGVLGFGQRFRAVSSTRPASSGSFGPENEPQLYSITSLPVTSLTIPDWFPGTRVQTTDIPWLRTISDPDGDQPEAAELEIREAASPQGSGALVARRYDTVSIPSQVLTGRQLDPMTAATGWAGDTDVTPGTEAQAPTGYSGDSLEFVFGSSSTDRGAWKVLAEPVDLSRYGGGALVRVHRRGSSNTSLTTGRLRLGSSASDYLEWEVLASGFTVDTWAEVVARLGTPTATVGTPDLTAIDRIGVWADVSGAYAGSWYLRDLRVGITQTAKDTPDGHIAWEASYDVRARARDDADALIAATTLSATEAAGQTVLSITDTTGMAAGQVVLVAGTIPEVRGIASVDSGSQITVTDALLHDHASGQAVTIYPWGPPSGWVTVPVARPPDVAPSAPADAATVTRPWPTFEWSFTGYGGRGQLRAEVHLALADGDEPFAVLSVEGDAEDATAPFLLLEDGQEVTWWVVVTDDSGLTGTSASRTFTTEFAEPTALEELNAIADPLTSEVVITWPESADPDLAFYVLEHQDESGEWVRIDGGPERSGDGRAPLVATEFHHLGGLLGINAYRLAVHNGWRAGEAVTTDAELGPPEPGTWPLVRRGLVVALRPSRAPRTHGVQLEEFRPPGGMPTHLSWGTSSVGRRVSLVASAIPSEDGALVPQLRALLGEGSWLKAPAGYGWHAMWGVLAAITDEPQDGGLLEVAVEFAETGAPVHGWVPEPEPEEEPEEEPAADAALDVDTWDFGEVELA